MLATILLAANATTQFPILSALIKELWLGAFAVIGTLVTLWLYFRKERREKRQELERTLADEKTALNTRIKKVEEELHNNTLKHTAAQLERERLVDANNTRMGFLESKVNQVDTIASEVNLMKTRLEVQSTLINSMNTNIADMKAESKAQFTEVLYLLKEKRYDK